MPPDILFPALGFAAFFSGAPTISAYPKPDFFEQDETRSLQIDQDPTGRHDGGVESISDFRPASANSKFQRTLGNHISCTGVGLHSGVKVSMSLLPAAPDTGVMFRRRDVAPEIADIPGRWDRVSEITLGTSLANDEGTTVATVEHLMAAFSGCGIDNVIVELDGAEVPIMDGSSAPFVFLIECAGTETQDVRKRAIRITRPVTVEDGERKVTLSPADDFSLSFEIDFESPVVARQTCEFDSASMTFKDELCRARTFGFLEDVNALHERGLARGGSLENVVVVSGDGVINDDGLRFDDEFARHKALDAVGDLYLAGATILGRYEGVRAGHEMNNLLLRSLFADATAWEWVDQSVSDDLPDEDRVWQEAPAAAIA